MPSFLMPIFAGSCYELSMNNGQFCRICLLVNRSVRICLLFSGEADIYNGCSYSRKKTDGWAVFDERFCVFGSCKGEMYKC